MKRKDKGFFFEFSSDQLVFKDHVSRKLFAKKINKIWLELEWGNSFVNHSLFSR